MLIRNLTTITFFLIDLRQTYTVTPGLDINKEKDALVKLKHRVRSVNTEDYSDESKQEIKKQIQNCEEKLAALSLQLDKYEHGLSERPADQMKHDYSYVKEVILAMGGIRDLNECFSYKLKRIAASMDVTNLRLHVGMLGIKQNLEAVKKQLRALFDDFRCRPERSDDNMNELDVD